MATSKQSGDPASERDFLAILCNNPHKIAEASELVHPSQLTGERAKIFYDALLSLTSRNGVIDISSVCSEIDRAKGISAFGGRSSVAEIFGRYANEAYFTSICTRIRSHASIRELNDLAVGAISDLSKISPEEPAVMDLVDSLQGKLSDIVSKGTQDDVGESWIEARAMAQGLAEPETQGTGGVMTGFADVDDVLRGLRNGQLILLAARSRVGKTSMACDIIRNVASQGQTVVFFSLEMTRREIWERMICGAAGVSIHALKDRAPTEEESSRLRSAGDELGSRLIVVKDSPSVTPMSMRGFARKIQHKHGLGLVVVDYLQCIGTGKDKQNRYELVSEVSRQMKVLARTLNVPVIALCQLNRQAEEDAPKLSQLRESGSLEQDADVVMLLNRPSIFDPDADPTLATLDIAKHRNGPCQMLRLHFDAGSVSFRDRAPDIEDFSKAPTESPVAPPKKKRKKGPKSSGGNWWGSNPGSSYD
jgi:replicative DNA helicase